MVSIGLDRRLNRAQDKSAMRRMAGIAACLVLVILSLGIGWLLHRSLAALPGGWVAEALLISAFLAQNSLYRHVAAVARGLREEGLAGGRRAVARIVGRDPESLDEAGVSRAALESLAENFSDGVTAPLFWALLLGLPGILAYKAVNTADSMIGHRTPRHLAFGWASARLDDLLNLIPARLAGLVLAATALLLPGMSGAGGAPRHGARCAPPSLAERRLAGGGHGRGPGAGIRRPAPLWGRNRRGSLDERRRPS